MKKRRVGAVMACIALAGVTQAALVAEWNFDDQNMTNSGSSAGLHDGSVVSGVATNPVAGTAVYTTNTPSGTGFALDLSSATEYMLIADSSSNAVGYANTFDSATNFSYSMWILNTNGTWNGYGSIASKGFENWKGDDALKMGFELRAQNFTDAANGVRVEFWGETSVQQPAPYTDLTDGSWHLLTYTYDGTVSNLNLYVDGALVASGAGVNFRQAPEHLLLFGAVAHTGTQQSDCVCDTIQFYDHALSAAEVESLYIPQLWFTTDVGELEIDLVAPATLVTGAVNVAYMSSTNVEVNVSITNETHVGAFSLPETMLVFTNTAPDSTPVNIVFDVDQTGGMVNGEIASCTAVITWNEQGSAEVTEIEIPVSVEYQVVLTNVFVSLNSLVTDVSSVSPINLTTNGTTDWVMLGMGGSTSSRNEMDGSDYIGEVTVIGGHGAFAGNAYQSTWSNGSPVVVTNNVQGSWEGQGATGALSFSVSGLPAGEYSMDLYCSKYRSTAQLTVIKDGGSVVQEFTQNGTAVTRYGVFTVDFTIEEPSDSLDFLYEQVTRTGAGNVGLTAITLAGEEPLPLEPPVIVVSMDTAGLVMSWDGGGLFDVLTNSNISIPTGWGVYKANVASPVTNAVEGEVQLFYKLETENE